MSWLSRATFGWFLVGLATFFAFGALVSAGKRGWERSDTPGWWFLVFLPMVIGVLLIGSKSLRNLAQRQNQLEDEVLQEIFRHNGAISAATLAHSSHLTLDDAADTLRHLAHRGHLMPDLDDSGVMVYTLGLTSAAPGLTQSAAVGVTNGKTNTPSMGLKQISSRRRAIGVVTCTMLAGLFFVSVYLSVFAMGVWQKP